MFYTMGEVTEMFDVNPSLVRFWTKRFDILKPQTNKKGNRLFTPQDVKNLETIYHLVKERGMTLAGVEKYLKTHREEAERDTELARRLQTIRSLLVEIREELKEEPEDEETISFIVRPPFEAGEETTIVTDVDIPDPDEFAEEELPGEVVGEEPEPEMEPEFEEQEEDFFDAQVSEPFIAQALFEAVEEEEPFFPETPSELTENQEENKTEAIDTQQSLF